MTLSDIFSIIEHIESSLDVDKFKFAGMHVWPHLRNQLVNGLAAEQRSSNFKGQGHVKRIAKKAALVPAGLLHLLKTLSVDREKGREKKLKADVVFLANSTEKRIQLRTGWYDVLVDPIIDYYERQGVSYVTFENAQTLQFAYPKFRKVKNMLPNSAMAYVFSLFFLPMCRRNERFEKGYVAYRELLNGEGLAKHIIDRRSLMIEVLYMKRLSKFFMRQLVRLKPRLVIVVCYYGYVGMALCHACRVLSIKCAEIQHGVQGTYHPAYGSFFKVPRRGFNIMPNIFLTWSETERDAIHNWAKDTVNIRATVMGNPLLPKFLSNNTLSNHFDAVFDRHFSKSNGRCRALISLQRGLFLPHIFLKLLKQGKDDFFWFFRFHPAMTSKEKDFVTNQLMSTGRSNYDVKFASEFPLYALLRNVDIHITQISSVVIDAAHFNIRSIVIEKFGAEYYGEYIKNGFVKFCNDPDELLGMLRENARSRIGFSDGELKCESYDNRISDSLNNLLYK